MFSCIVITKVLKLKWTGDYGMISFIEINADNYEKVLKLELNEAQSKFVAPNVRSLADCYYYRDAGDVFPYAIQDKDEVIGFILLDLDEEEKEFMIWRMMIDKNHQGKGYGRRTVKKVIELAKQEKKANLLIADYVKGNEVMGKLLRSEGFEDHSFNEEWNEYVLHYRL